MSHLDSPEAYRAYLEEHGQRPGNADAFGFRDYYMRFWDVPKGARILDLGSYVGATAIHYALLGHEVFGMDGSQTYADRAAENTRRTDEDIEERMEYGHDAARNWVEPMFLDCLFEDIDGIPGLGYFDACCCTEVLHHVIDPAVVVKKAHECLRPGGTFFCTVPTKRKKVDAREFTLEELGKVVRTAGFDVVQLFELRRKDIDAGVPQFIAEGIK